MQLATDEGRERPDTDRMYKSKIEELLKEFDPGADARAAIAELNLTPAEELQVLQMTRQIMEEAVMKNRPLIPQ